MNVVTFWFDPISPYAYLAFERLPQVLEGVSHEVVYRPVLLGALLQHHGTKGPAEVEAKRQWTFRQVHWLAAQSGIAMCTPRSHPFNPLSLLRLALAAGDEGACNRRVADALFGHVWRGREGDDALDPARLAALEQQIAPAREPGSDTVKAELRGNTEQAIAQGVFGVPSFTVNGRIFFGLDSLPMVRAALLGDAWFDGPAWDREGAPRPGLRRNA